MYEHEEVSNWFVAMPGCQLKPSPLERGDHLYRSSDPPSYAIEPYTPTVQPSNRIVIWHHPNCGACRNSEPIFSALEQNTDGFTVERRIATAEAVQSMVNANGHPHIVMLPTYDLIWPENGSQSVYGPDLRVTSVQNNNLSLLQQQVPSITRLLTPPSQ
jgi:hypothetical protein